MCLLYEMNITIHENVFSRRATLLYPTPVSIKKKESKNLQRVTKVTDLGYDGLLLLKVTIYCNKKNCKHKMETKKLCVVTTYEKHISIYIYIWSRTFSLHESLLPWRQH